MIIIIIALILVSLSLAYHFDQKRKVSNIETHERLLEKQDELIESLRKKEDRNPNT